MDVLGMFFRSLEKDKMMLFLFLTSAVFFGFLLSFFSPSFISSFSLPISLGYQLSLKFDLEDIVNIYPRSNFFLLLLLPVSQAGPADSSERADKRAYKRAHKLAHSCTPDLRVPRTLAGRIAGRRLHAPAC